MSKKPMWTPSFLAGYRAFVFGGKDRMFYYNGKFRKATGGILPPDYLSEEAKAEWNAGIKYARKERKECREL